MEHDLASTGNVLEAVLWGVIALVFCGFAIRDGGKRRRLWAFVAFAFALFGLSDVIEAHTGAWWRPWWLFVLKCGCVAMLLGGVHWHRKLRSQEKDGK